jgi:hypothetical protein
MINFQDIEEGEIVKVLVNMNDIEEELFARVYKHTGNFLHVKYLIPTEKVWKGACVYELEETNNMVEPETIVEHYQGSILFDEVEGIKKIPRTPYYYFEEEHDPEESDDEIVSSDEEDGYEVDDSFCEEDGIIDGRPETAADWKPPPGSEHVDREWNEWQPQTEGAKRFKERVDLIEKLARQHLDNLEFY